ncbi:MAG: hypothetical protein SPK09_06695 [Porphyromonas sp.]|nr:hypothetical protein [Porphyromonas sp.]
MIYLIFCLVALGLTMLLLSIKLIIKKDGKFPSSHVGSQQALREQGISCHTSQHRDAQGQRNLAERLAEREA